MNNNKIGCLGWIVVILILVPFIELIINLWYVFVIGVIIYLIWNYRNKRKIKEKDNQQSSVVSTPPSTTKDVPEHLAPTKPKYLPQEINYKDVLEYMDLEPPIMKIEGNKYINTWTGNVTASPKAMANTVDKIKRFGHQKTIYANLLDLSKINSNEALRQYYEVVSTPFFEGGMLAYQRGDFDKAEIWWLKVLDVAPYIVSERLRVMYRKQHRYGDVVEAYLRAIKFGKGIITTTQENILEKEKNKAGEVLLNHLNDDQSRGLVTLSSLVDNKFVEELKGTEHVESNNTKPRVH